MLRLEAKSLQSSLRAILINRNLELLQVKTPWLSLPKEKICLHVPFSFWRKIYLVQFKLLWNVAKTLCLQWSCVVFKTQIMSKSKSI